MAKIILFDGVCNFCDSSVQFIIKRDPRGNFKFASLQSETGQKLLKQVGLKDEIDSFVLIDDDQYYLKSSAALKVSRNLNGAWSLFSLLTVIPVPIRDYLYDILAKNRYKWFGKKDSCMLPSPEVRSRFLD
ncbi:thiol-disulfide oxidoreductase DCC family protein [Bacillus sp. CGMCC 1.16607]|uniref:thiol-disulfide oxidoreductase DCC family protein n=1 Tax=Bacillus sp. CGMCC 1.16607 TaxID=3351842 RepID=UPI003641CF5E